MTRLAFVVQRCGAEVNGGSERLCREVARHCSEHAEVEVLTTCALDYRTWANHYPAGPDSADGLPLRRFPVAEERSPAAFDALSERIRPRLREVGPAEAEAWLRAQGPWAPSLFAHLRENRGRYDAVYFFTYLYATTFFGLPEVADRAVLVPCAHDEWPIYLPSYERLFALARAFVFNTPEERSFLRRRFPSLALAGPVAGTGVDRPARPARPERFRERFDLDGPYLLYLGRVDVSKGCAELLEHYRSYRARRPDAPPLVLVGGLFMEVPESEGVICTGFVDEASKWDALAGCTALLMPSPFESLSIALLEAWSAARPVLVNGRCEVLVGQTRRARGGLWYADAREFAAALDRLRRAEIGAALGAQGRRFVEANALWPVVVERYLSVRGGAREARPSLS